MKGKTKVSVFIVDDHPMVRTGLVHLLETAGVVVSGMAGGIRETLAHPALQESRLVLVDLALGEDSGFQLIKHLRERGLAILVYSMHEGSNVVRRALEAGANGYVTKREAGQTLLDAIGAVVAGESYLSPRVASALSSGILSDNLSEQQQQIYRLLGRGLTNEEIARQLNISVRTLESYCVRIMDKLGIHGTRTLRQQAIRDTGSAV